MQHLDLAFGISLAYGGVVLVLIAILMTTAHNKTPTEVAFTVREWLFSALFGGTGVLLIMNTGDRSAYVIGVSLTLDLVMTIILIALFHTHLRWRRINGSAPNTPTESHPLSMESSHDTSHPGQEPGKP